MSRQIERRISFNGGEVSPWIEPRIDLEKYRSSARRMENFRPAIYGGAFTRAGTLFVAEQPHADKAGRLVAFEFSATTTMILAFTSDGDDEGVLTVYTTGETPAVAWTGATPYAAEELPELQFQQINDLIYVTHPSHPPQVITRITNNHWTVAALVQEWPALRPENISAVTLSPSATTGSGITITASAATFNAQHVGSRWLIKHRRTVNTTQLLLTSAVGTSSPNLFVLGDWSLTVTSGQGTGTWDVLAVVERSADGTTWETIRSMPVSRSDRSGIITGTEIDPCYLRIRMTDKENAPSHGSYTLEAVDPDHYGIFDITGYTNPTLVTATVVSKLGGTSATQYWAEAAWSDYRGWPRTLCIHEQRLMFGGNASQPQTVWGSIIDDFHNFRLGADDDMGLALSFAGQKANAIQWMVSQGSLIIGTSGAEGPVGARDAEKTLTPTNARTGKFTSTGSAFIQAIPVQDTVIFIQRNGRKAWEFSFVFESDGYKAQDLTLLAEHITAGQIVQVALQRYPEPVLWCIDSGGQLLGLAYERNQGVAGWFRYVTDGAFESVAVVSGSGEEDQLWVTVRRGGTRFIERFQPDRVRLLKDGRQELLCCADAAVIYDGAPATVIGGLDHLEGRTVCVVADGSPVAGKVVSGGEITLEAPAAVVITGLPFTCYLQPTYLETNDPNSISKVAWKNIHRVDLELWKSLGCSVSANEGETWERVEFLQQGDLLDTPLPLYSGYKQALCDSRSERKTSPIVRQDQPLPLNLLSLHVWHEMNAG